MFVLNDVAKLRQVAVVEAHGHRARKRDCFQKVARIAFPLVLLAAMHHRNARFPEQPPKHSLSKAF